MAIDPFPSKTKPTLAATCGQIRAKVAFIGTTLCDGYTGLKVMVNANPDFTAEEIARDLGADYAALQRFAVLVKTVVNAAKPDTIKDSVPVATITMPTGLG